VPGTGEEKILMPRIFQEPNYGVTERSLEWVRRYKSDLGPLFRIRCFIHPHRVAGLEGDQWVEFEDQAGNKIIATGFGWGYQGTGPAGLAKILRELGIQGQIITTARWLTQNSEWRIDIKENTATVKLKQEMTGGESSWEIMGYVRYSAGDCRR
jgi:hypothetical protein